MTDQPHLDDMSENELADLLKGMRHRRQQQAQADATDTLAALFGGLDRDGQELMDALDEAVTEMKENDA